MSTQKERLRQGIETAGQGHAVKLLEGEQADKPKQTPGLPLSPVRRLPPSEIRLSEKNQKAFAPLSGPEFERLKADIAERGIIVPLILRTDKTLIAGHNRLRAAQAIGLETVPVQYVETELSPESERVFVVKDNLLRRQLTAELKERLIIELYGRQILEAKHGGARGNQHSKSAKVKFNLGKTIEAETGIKASTAKQIMAKHRAAAAKNTPSDRTEKAQASSVKQGRGENEKALRSFAGSLHSALRAVELENEQTLKAAIGITKAWLKDLERKHRAAR